MNATPNRDMDWRTARTDRPELSMHRLFRLLQQRNRYVNREPSTKLSLAEAHLLTELDATSDLSQKALCSLLGLAQSHLSQMCHELERRELLVSSTSDRDRRSKLYRLSRRGRTVVKASDIVTDETFAEFAKPLGATDREELVAFFQAIADGYGHPAGTLRPAEPPFRLQQRRITRCFALLGTRAFGSELNGTEWQVLCEIAAHSGYIVARDIEQRLIIPKPTLSLLLDRLERAELITRRIATYDARQKVLEATGRGRALVIEIESRAEQDLITALRPHSRAQIEEWLRILAIYTVGDVGVGSAESPTDLFEIAESAEQRKSARRFLLERAVDQGNTDHLPDTIAAPSHRTVVHFRHGEMVGVYDLTPTSSTWVLSSAGWTGSPCTSLLIRWGAENAIMASDPRRIVVEYPPLIDHPTENT